MKLKEVQKSSTKALKSSENDLKIKNVNVHKTIEQLTKTNDFWSSLRHQEAIRRAPRSSRRGPKSRFIDPVDVLELPERGQPGYKYA